MIVTLTVNPSVDAALELESGLGAEVEKSLSYRRMRRFAGGGGINVAKVIRRFWGPAAPLRVLGFIGGATGDLLKLLLQEEGIDTRDLIPIASPTRMNLLLIPPKGREVAVSGKTEVSPEEDGQLLKKINEMERIRYVVISGSPPSGKHASYYNQFIRAFKQKGATVILDTKSDVLIEALSEKPDMIKPNLVEFNNLLEKTIGESLLSAKEKRREKIEDILIEKYFKVNKQRIEPRDKEFDGLLAKVRSFHRSHNFLNPLLISLGAAGMLGVTKRSVIRAFLRPPLEPDSKRSAVAAGDTAVGAYLLGIITSREGEVLPNLRQAGLTAAATPRVILKVAVAASSATCTKPGSEVAEPADVPRLAGRVKAKLYPGFRA